MTKARRLKHLFGGAMRQAGIFVAAAGTYALENHVDRLADDHVNADWLAEGLAEGGLPVDPAEVETNFVLLDARALGLGSRRPRPASGQRASCFLRPPGRDTCEQLRTSTCPPRTSSAQSKGHGAPSRPLQ